MSIQPETEQQQTEVKRVEQPAHGHESPAPPRLSEGQLKLALTEMAESDPTFLKQLFKSAASTEDGPSSSPSKAGHSPSPAKDGADNPHGSSSHGPLGKPASLPTPTAEHPDCVSRTGEQIRLSRARDAGWMRAYPAIFLCVINLYLSV